MDTKEALNVLEMFLHKQCSLKRTEFAYDQITVWHAVNMAAEALEASQWIPVSEGLPEESGDYLVTMLWWNEVEKEQATLLKPIKVLDGKYYWGCPQKMAVLEWFKCFDDETGEDCSEWFIGEDMIPDDLEILAWQKTPKRYGEEE